MNYHEKRQYNKIDRFSRQTFAAEGAAQNAGHQAGGLSEYVCRRGADPIGESGPGLRVVRQPGGFGAMRGGIPVYGVRARHRKALLSEGEA